MQATSISELAGSFYEAGLDDTHWPTALAELGGALDCNGAALAFLDADERALGFYGEGDPEAVASYVEHYRALDCVYSTVARGPVGRVWSDEMVQTKAELHATEFHCDWSRKAAMEHSLHTIALDHGGVRGFFWLARPPSRPAFDRAEIAFIETLLPHVRRAMAAHLKLRSAAATGACALDCLTRLAYAAFLIGPDGVVTPANAAAEALLRGGAGLSLRGGHVVSAAADQARALGRAIGRAVRDPREGGWLALDRADGGGALHCLITPIGADARRWAGTSDAAALLLIDADVAVGGRDRALAALFGLTAAEAKVAERTVSGEGAPAIAVAMRLAPTTVRTHLQRAFEKTGTRGQTDLAVLVARLAVDPPRSSDKP